MLKIFSREKLKADVTKTRECKHLCFFGSASFTDRNRVSMIPRSIVYILSANSVVFIFADEAVMKINSPILISM